MHMPLLEPELNILYHYKLPFFLGQNFKKN